MGSYDALSKFSECSQEVFHQSGFRLLAPIGGREQAEAHPGLARALEDVSYARRRPCGSK